MELIDSIEGEAKKKNDKKARKAFNSGIQTIICNIRMKKVSRKISSTKKH